MKKSFLKSQVVNSLVALAALTLATQMASASNGKGCKGADCPYSLTSPTLGIINSAEDGTIPAEKIPVITAQAEAYLSHEKQESISPREIDLLVELSVLLRNDSRNGDTVSNDEIKRLSNAFRDLASEVTAGDRETISLDDLRAEVAKDTQ